MVVRGTSTGGIPDCFSAHVSDTIHNCPINRQKCHGCHGHGCEVSFPGVMVGRDRGMSLLPSRHALSPWPVNFLVRAPSRDRSPEVTHLATYPESLSSSCRDVCFSLEGERGRCCPLACFPIFPIFPIALMASGFAHGLPAVNSADPWLDWWQLSNSSTRVTPFADIEARVQILNGFY
jgi:hypothetical protein